MKLREYLATLPPQTNMLDEISYRENASQVVPVEIHLQFVSSTDKSPNNLLKKALQLLDTHPDSPFHELMTVEFLLANINFLPKITEELSEIKTEIAQTIQNLYYLLEKPHPETASSGYNKRRRAQENYIKKEITADKTPGEPDDPLMLLALQYCLDNMDDDTFTYLTKYLEISDQAVTRRSSLAKVQTAPPQFLCGGQPDPKYCAALATLEFYRVSPANLTEEKHAAKNQRFYQEITRLLGGDTHGKSFLCETDFSNSKEPLSPPLLEFSNESSSVLSEDGESMRQTKPLSIQTVRASNMVFHFSASLPQSSIELLADIQVPATTRQDAVSFDRDNRSEWLIRESELGGQYSLLEPADTDAREPLTVEVGQGGDVSETNTPYKDTWRSVPSAETPNNDGQFSLDIKARLSPAPSVHAVEDSYQVPPSGNCCYSSIIVALMHGFFSGSIVQDSDTAGALNVPNGFFDKIQTRTEKYFDNIDVTRKFTFLLEQYKNQELLLLETIMVPALRKVIAEYALNTNEQVRGDLCALGFGGRTENHLTEFNKYFSDLQKLEDNKTKWGGPADLAVIEQMYKVRITGSRGQDLLERTEEEMSFPHLVIHHMSDTAQKNHYEVLLTDSCNTHVKNFCDAVMKTYEQNKKEQESNDFQLALLVKHTAQNTPSRSWRGQGREHLSSGKNSPGMFGSRVDSNRSQRSSASRQLSTGSTLSVTSRLSVEGSVSVRQHSNSENFAKFKTAITQYYTDLNNRKDNLKALVNIVTSLSDSTNGIIVYASVAIAALNEHADGCIDDIYAHLYILLHSIVFATSTTAALTNREISRKAVEAKKDAATILEWLSNPQDDKLVSALTEVHARMLDKECSAADTPVQMLSWRDELPCSNRHDQSCLANPSPHIDAAVLTILRGLPFMWSSLYTNGAHETNDRIIEERRYYEVIAAYALQDILNDSLRAPLSMEEQWLILKAIADYNKVRAYQKNHPKSRLLAESPFFNAIRLLAVTYPLASTDASAQIRERELCQHLYERAVPALFKYEGELLVQQKLLKDELKVLVLEVEHDIQPVSICPFPSPVVRILFNDDETKKESVGSNTPADTFSNSFWNNLYETHIRDTGSRSARRLTEDEIKFILNDFDRKCEKASNDEKNKLLQLLTKAFCEMQQIFQDPNNHQRTSFSMFSFGRRESSPINFNSFMDCIAPKESLPPYAFAQYCAYQSSRICFGTPEITHLLPHEEDFIRKHLVSLYDNTDELNQMFDTLGDNVTSNKTSAIRMIYAALDREISALEAKGNNVTPEEVKPYYKMIFSQKTRASCSMDTKKKNGSDISQRIKSLHLISTQQSTPTYSKK